MLDSPSLNLLTLFTLLGNELQWKKFAKVQKLACLGVYLSSPFCTSICLLSALYVLYFLHLPGSEIVVYEGDILLRRGRRSAINCESCLWPKSQDGLVKVPINISSDFCECMQMDAVKLALIFQSLYSLLFYVSVACTKSNLCPNENLLTCLFC